MTNNEKIIKSINFDETEILKNILELHCNNNPIELDATFSTGNFYKNKIIQEPKYKYDINPQVEGVIKSNAEHLPHENNSIKTIMFDPPFLATQGGSLWNENNRFNNQIVKRFGSYPNEKELHKFYNNALKEFYRILDNKGILIFKCQDKVSSGKQYFCHCLIYEMATQIGFYAKDLFILMAKSRIIADWQIKNQQHARKFHCYYWVFQKCSKNNMIIADYV